MNITSPVMINEDIIEFDIQIKSVRDSFYLTSYQCSFLFNTEIVKGGRLIFMYVEGTSQLRNLPNYGIGINSLDGKPKLTFASTADADTITEDQKLVGKFRLLSTTPFLTTEPHITWNFSGFISTILTGESFNDITLPENFYYDYNKDPNLKLGKSATNFVIPNEFKL